jgi:hypothetical protein
MIHEFLVRVELERESGKFASRDDIAERLLESIEAADPGEIDGVGADGESVYTIVEWSVDEQPRPKPSKRKRP